MRDLKGKDFISILKIVNKMKPDTSVLKGKDAEGLGIAMALMLSEGLVRAEKETFAFLADVAGMEPDELREADISEVFRIVEHVKEQEGLKYFFKLLQGDSGRSKAS